MSSVQRRLVALSTNTMTDTTARKPRKQSTRKQRPTARPLSTSRVSKATSHRAASATALPSEGQRGKALQAIRVSNAVLKRSQSPALPLQETTAESVVSGLAINAMTATKFSQFAFGNVDLTACLGQLNAAVDRVHRGDLRDSEAMLTAQAMTLNALFGHLANLADRTEYVDKFDTYLRLALKAQGQCRATLETLAEIKYPPTVFAQQANVAHGPQQVNNTASTTGRRAKRSRVPKRKNGRKRTK